MMERKRKSVNKRKKKKTVVLKDRSQVAFTWEDDEANKQIYGENNL